MNISAASLPSLAEIRAEKARRAAEADRERVRRDAEGIRARCATLAGFVREAWHVIEPSTPLVWSWHLQAMCDHLQAISDGRLKPWLIINVPPGSSKSTIVSVMWQAWMWTFAPSKRFVTTSFEEGNVTRDTRKTRDLIASEWYQALWPHIVFSRKAETSFANTATGTREGVAFVSITGKRGDVVVVDDPHSLDGVESEADRNKATRRFLEGGLNRVNDQTTSAIVVVMQRLHEGDLTGALLARDLGFIHLMIPMEFEPERACVTPLPWHDPRSYDGELMDPVRMPRPAVERLRIASQHAFAGQYQQRPTAREGGMFKREWFGEGKIIHFAPEGTVWVRYWDLAGTELKKGATRGARTAGVKMGRTPDGRFVVGDLVLAAKEGDAVRKLVRATAEKDGTDVEIGISQDGGQAGKIQAKDYIAMLAGFVARKHIETGDKATRAEPFAVQCEAGNVYLITGDWNTEWIEEVCTFPGGARKDIVDACSGAFGRLIPPPGRAAAGHVGPELIRRNEADDLDQEWAAEPSRQSGAHPLAGLF